MAVDLNNQLKAFLKAAYDHDDNARVTMLGNQIMIDRDDVGVFSRIFRPQASARQIKENNDVRTALLNALRDQYKGLGEIPQTVWNALNGSSLRGKSDMSEAGGQVNSGRPLTARRIRAILGQVMVDLNSRSGINKGASDANKGKGTEGTQKAQSEIKGTGESSSGNVQKEMPQVRTEQSPETVMATEEESRALDGFRQLMHQEVDDRVMSGIDQKDAGKDPVTKYAESYCRVIIDAFASEEHEGVPQFWQRIGLADPDGDAELDDITSQFARGLKENRDVFDRLSQAIRKHICSGGSPEKLANVSECVISDALKAFRAQSEKEMQALKLFRGNMDLQDDARVQNGLNGTDGNKDFVTRYAESLCRGMMVDFGKEVNKKIVAFWQRVFGTDPNGTGQVDDVALEFKKGIGANQKVFNRLSQAIRQYICDGGRADGLENLAKRVVSEELKEFRKDREPLPLDDKTIFGFTSGMPKEARAYVESRVLANTSSIKHDAKWFNAYTQWTMESLQNNKDFVNFVWGVGDKTTSSMFMEALTRSDYIFDEVHKIIDNSISHRKTHAEVQGDVQKYVIDFLKEFNESRNSVKDTESKGAIAPKRKCRPEGLNHANELPSGVVLSQGQNTCPIIGLMNAMLMTSNETAEKAKAFMTRHSDGKRTYFEFPPRDGKGQNIRAYTDEFETEYPQNKAYLSDFEKAVFVAMKKAGLKITIDRTETQPGNVFEISPVYVLFGFKDPEHIGNVSGDHPSAMQQCLDGKKIAEAIKAGKPCVLRAPGHFVGIESVKFDENGLPTYTYFNSSSQLRGTLKPENNTGYQFYIGEKA